MHMQFPNSTLPLNPTRERTGIKALSTIKKPLVTLTKIKNKKEIRIGLNTPLCVDQHL